MHSLNSRLRSSRRDADLNCSLVPRTDDIFMNLLGRAVAGEVPVYRDHPTIISAAIRYHLQPGSAPRWRSRNQERDEGLESERVPLRLGVPS